MTEQADSIGLSQLFQFIIGLDRPLKIQLSQQRLRIDQLCIDANRAGEFRLGSEVGDSSVGQVFAKLACRCQPDNLKLFGPAALGHNRLLVPEILRHHLKVDGLLRGCDVDELIGSVNGQPMQEMPISLEGNHAIVSKITTFPTAVNQHALYTDSAVLAIHMDQAGFVVAPELGDVIAIALGQIGGRVV